MEDCGLDKAKKMADSRSFAISIFISSFLFLNTYGSPVNISPESVPTLLVHSALNSLNTDSPTKHTYKGGNLISAQKVLEPDFVIFRLTLNLETVCDEGFVICPREACAIDLRENKSGVIIVDKDSIQCMYLYPQSTQDDLQQTQELVQETVQDPEFAEQSLNQSLKLDHEVDVSVAQNTDLPDKPFIAVRAPNANYCPGCPYEMNPNLPGLAAFGVQALDMMDRLGQNDFKHKLLKIVKVTRSVPPGSNVVQYNLLMKIGESNCLKTTLIDRANCQLQANSPVTLCQVTYEERPWQQSGRQIINNNCTGPSDLENEVNASLNPSLTSNSNRDQPQQVDSVQEIIGKTAHIDQLVQDGKIGNYESLIDRLFETQMSSTTIESSSSNSITESREQVTETSFVKIELEKQDRGHEVLHFFDKQKEFDAFLEDFDVPIRSDAPQLSYDNRPVIVEDIIEHKRVDTINKQIISSTDTSHSSGPNLAADNHQATNADGEYGVDSSRNKRSLINTMGENLGVATPISINDTKVQRYANWGLEKFSENYEGNYEPVLIEIINATKQVVSGILYKITVKFGESNCRKKTKENCQLQAGAEPKQCLLTVWSKPWEEGNEQNEPKIAVDCDLNDVAVRRIRSIPGGVSPISTDSAEVKHYASLGVEKMSSNFEGTNEPILTEIVQAISQVVAGVRYVIDARVGTSDCPKGTKQNCKLLAGSKIQDCKITVWSRPWLEGKSEENPLIIETTCGLNERRRRTLRGVNYSSRMLAQSDFMRHELLFNDFTEKFNKTYTLLERKQRFKIFQDNMRMVQELQCNEQGTATYGVTMFSDLTPQEFKKNYLGLRLELRLDNEIPIPMADIPNVTLPIEYDWRNYNVVTAVKDQGQCGSCWAFSVTGNVEGQYAIHHGKLLSLSEQELVDCDSLDQGCNGGLPDNAYRVLEKLGGLELENDYPYDAKDETCHFDKRQVKVSVVSAVNITHNETQMAQWLYKNGPISIGINANAMQFYVGGVSHPFKFLCNPNNLNHGVLIVGYGLHEYPLFHKKLPYWIIKNSWGPSWGEQGYYRIYRGDGTCGVNQMASSAVVA